MRTVAIGRVFSVLAHAKEVGAAFLRRKMKRAITAVAFLMRAVAKWLIGRQTARAKAIINTRLKLYLGWRLTANFGKFLLHKSVLCHPTHPCNRVGNLDRALYREKLSARNKRYGLIALIKHLNHKLVNLNRKALAITLTELSDMAVAAMMGESRMPKSGYRIPAAIGTPAAL